jgi:hypothetical protein
MPHQGQARPGTVRARNRKIRNPWWRRAILRVEELEARSMLSTAPWTPVTFDGLTPGTLPSSWTQSSGTPGVIFQASTAQAQTAPNGLAVGRANARAWMTDSQPADVQVSAAVYLNSLNPAQVIARGSHLNTDDSQVSYYAVQVARGTTGTQVWLVKVVNGTSTTLGGLTSTSYVSGVWVQATLEVSGQRLRAQVFRPDTAQYLTSAGAWQAAPAYALERFDRDITGGGYVGLGRDNTYADTLYFDNFSVVAANSSESFDSTAPGSLPSGWTPWSNPPGVNFQASTAQALSAPNGLAVAQASARVWMTASQPADVQVSASVYLNSTNPARVLARGSNLGSATGAYFYAVQVVKGLELSLIKVVNGAVTTLDAVPSAGLPDMWVQETLDVNGSQLRAQLFRPDTAQYLNSAGAWQAAPTYALDLTDSTDTAISGGGYVGLTRPNVTTDTLYFDNFAVSWTNTLVEQFDTTMPGYLPSTWTPWTDTPSVQFQASTAQALSAPNGLSVDRANARAWVTASWPADVQVSASVYLNSLNPARVLARGSNLNTSNSASFYAVQVDQGL